jgi:hypothetical protein
VPDSWDPATYRQRAAAWRDKAITLPEDHPERETCLKLAEGYDRLATLIEVRTQAGSSPPPVVPRDDSPDTE